ncbi:MAG TPA: OmpH family outer membrane protein [Cytophagales bacterium]|nr:OmpH family outer membrane protein [Cytophagales bacterium]
MKNLSIALNIVLLIAVIVLYVLHFSDKKDSAISTSNPTIDAGELTIAYVNSDSLVKNYNLYKQLSKTLEEKRDKLGKNFAVREKGFQNEVNKFQQSAQRMSPGEIQAREENLMMKRQGLLQEQERLSQELMQDQAVLNDSLYTKITKFLDDYSKQKNYHLVLSHQQGGAILYGHDSLEITREVIKGLNEEFDKTKK